MITTKVSSNDVTNEKEPKRNCSPELVRSWKAIQKANNSNTRFPTSTTAVAYNQTPTVQSGTSNAITVYETAYCQLQHVEPPFVYPQQGNHPQITILGSLPDIYVRSQLEQSLAQEHVQMDRFQRPVQRRLLFQSIPKDARHFHLNRNYLTLFQAFNTYHSRPIKVAFSKHSKSLLKTVTSSKCHGLASTHLQGSNGNQLGYILPICGTDYRFWARIVQLLFSGTGK
jgi:hypothetical protein